MNEINKMLKTIEISPSKCNLCKNTFLFEFSKETHNCEKCGAIILKKYKYCANYCNKNNLCINCGKLMNIKRKNY